MSTATRLPTVMAHWAPITRHYAVDGGHLAVTVQRLLSATGTDVYYCDENAIAPVLEAIAQFPDGIGHTEALESLGYTVIDDIGDEPEPEVTTTVADAGQSVMDMLPPQIAAMIAAATPPGDTET